MDHKYSIIDGSDDQVVIFNKRIGIDLDLLMEQCEIALGMSPDGLQANIVLCEDREEVNRVFFDRYGKKVDYVAFMSKTEKTIWVSLPDARKDRLAHEFGHVIVETYLPGKLSSNIHELLAQYCERHFND
jgi:hypothetical protein